MPVFSFADVQLRQKPNMQCSPLEQNMVFKTPKLCIWIGPCESKRCNEVVNFSNNLFGLPEFCSSETVSDIAASQRHGVRTRKSGEFGEVQKPIPKPHGPGPSPRTPVGAEYPDQSSPNHELNDVSTTHGFFPVCATDRASMELLAGASAHTAGCGSPRQLDHAAAEPSEPSSSHGPSDVSSIFV